MCQIVPDRFKSVYGITLTLMHSSRRVPRFSYPMDINRVYIVVDQRYGSLIDVDVRLGMPLAVLIPLVCLLLLW